MAVTREKGEEVFAVLSFVVGKERRNEEEIKEEEEENCKQNTRRPSEREGKRGRGEKGAGNQVKSERGIALVFG